MNTNNKQIGGAFNTKKARLFNAVKTFGLAFADAFATHGLRNLTLNTAKSRYENLRGKQVALLPEYDLHFLARYKAYEEEANKKQPSTSKVEQLIDVMGEDYTLVRTNSEQRSELTEIVAGTLSEVTHAFLGQCKVEEINAKDAQQYLQYHLVRKSDTLNHIADYELQNV